MTRKHLARAQRDRILSRWLLVGTIVVAVAVVGLIFYAFIGYPLINMRQPILSVDGEALARSTFVSRVRLLQVSTFNELQYMESILPFLSEDPNLTNSYQQRIEQLSAELSNPGLQGQQIMQNLIRELIIRQEANARGIFVTSDEVNTLVAEQGFEYYVNGTPTPQPSPTVDTMESSIPTTTVLAEGTPTASVTPGPTATAYTEDIYLERYDEQIASFKRLSILEADYLMYYESSIYYERLMEALKVDLPTEADHVWLRHIQVSTLDEAEDVLQRLEDGEAWEDLAAELTLDEFTQFFGGDLGWMAENELANQFGSDFSTAVFAAEIDEVLEPLETDLGWHIVQVLDRENRTLDDTVYEQRLQDTLEQVIADRIEQAEIVVDENWADFIPEPRDVIEALLP
jgi:foldase protein PrsA